MECLPKHVVNALLFEWIDPVDLAYVSTAMCRKIVREWFMRSLKRGKIVSPSSCISKRQTPNAFLSWLEKYELPINVIYLQNSLFLMKKKSWEIKAQHVDLSELKETDLPLIVESGMIANATRLTVDIRFTKLVSQDLLEKLEFFDVSVHDQAAMNMVEALSLPNIKRFVIRAIGVWEESISQNINIMRLFVKNSSKLERVDVCGLIYDRKASLLKVYVTRHFTNAYIHDITAICADIAMVELYCVHFETSKLDAINILINAYVNTLTTLAIHNELCPTSVDNAYTAVIDLLMSPTAVLRRAAIATTTPNQLRHLLQLLQNASFDVWNKLEMIDISHLIVDFAAKTLQCDDASYPFLGEVLLREGWRLGLTIKDQWKYFPIPIAELHTSSTTPSLQHLITLAAVEIIELSFVHLQQLLSLELPLLTTIHCQECIFESNPHLQFHGQNSIQTFKIDSAFRYRLNVSAVVKLINSIDAQCKLDEVCIINASKIHILFTTTAADVADAAEEQVVLLITNMRQREVFRHIASLHLVSVPIEEEAVRRLIAQCGRYLTSVQIMRCPFLTSTEVLLFMAHTAPFITSYAIELTQPAAGTAGTTTSNSSVSHGAWMAVALKDRGLRRCDFKLTLSHNVTYHSKWKHLHICNGCSGIVEAIATLAKNPSLPVAVLGVSDITDAEMCAAIVNTLVTTKKIKHLFISTSPVLLRNGWLLDQLSPLLFQQLLHLQVDEASAEVLCVRKRYPHVTLHTETGVYVPSVLSGCKCLIS